MDDGAERLRSEKPDELEAPFSELFLDCCLPYAALMFGALPAMYAPLGPWAWMSALTNSIAAEAIANFHTLVSSVRTTPATICIDSRIAHRRVAKRTCGR